MPSWAFGVGKWVNCTPLVGVSLVGTAGAQFTGAPHQGVRPFGSKPCAPGQDKYEMEPLGEGSKEAGASLFWEAGEGHGF